MRSCALFPVALVGCSSAQNAATATAVQDVSDAVCQEAEANAQTDTAYVQFICSVLDPKGGPPKTFAVKIKADTAKAFASAHCPNASPKVSP